MFSLPLFLGEGDGTDLETEPPKLHLGSDFDSQQRGNGTIASFQVPREPSAAVGAGTGQERDRRSNQRQGDPGQVPHHEGKGIVAEVVMMMMMLGYVIWSLFNF
jgi:hypothetical protein